MTFTSKLKQELLEIMPYKIHCIRAECAGILFALGLVKKKKDNQNILYVLTETDKVGLKYFTLLKKAFNIEGNTSSFHSAVFLEKAEIGFVLDDVDSSVIKVLGITKESCDFDIDTLENVVLYKKCCKRAFLRAVFIANGSIADPQKSYHFEISMPDQNNALLVQRLIKPFGLNAKMIKRKSNYVVYLQDKESILDMLSILESSKYSMEMENLCIVKEVINNANRQTNCDNANIKRMVSATLKQVEDISYIIEMHGVEFLPENLREIAMIRLENKDESLTKLGELLDPPLTKSGVNHRLRKLSKLAAQLRNVSYKERDNGKETN